MISIEISDNPLEKRRQTTTRAQKNLIGLTEEFKGANIHKNYLNGLEPDEFTSGLNSLAAILKELYTGMINEPQKYAMKDASDVKGLVKNTNFLFLLAQNGVIRGDSLEVDGKILANALKNAKVTKPEIYFKFIEPLGFTASGLGKNIETSEIITVEFPDDKYLLTVLKAMADAVGVFSRKKPHQSNIYFELLDHRVLENYPATEPKLTMEYVISKLNNKSREVVKIFYEFIEPLAKCNIKGDIEWYWTPTFTLKSTKKVIMSFKLDLESHDLKLNLANIGKYTDYLINLPEKMVKVIKNDGWGCSNCSPNCGKPFEFYLDGIFYKKCICGSFVFINPDNKDSELLLGLLKKELEYQ
jgi:hypothetical protein